MFLDFREALKHEASRGAFERVSDLLRCDGRRHTEKEMYVIYLHVERTYRPGVGFTDTTDYLFDKRGELTNQNLLPIFWTPDKVIS